jgi:hypothetical protein
MLGLAEPDAHRAYHRGYVARRYRRYQRSADSDVRPTLAKVSLTGREPSAARHYDAARLEAACDRELDTGARSYSAAPKSISFSRTSLGRLSRGCPP